MAYFLYLCADLLPIDDPPRSLSQVLKVASMDDHALFAVAITLAAFWSAPFNTPPESTPIPHR